MPLLDSCDRFPLVRDERSSPAFHNERWPGVTEIVDGLQ